MGFERDIDKLLGSVEFIRTFISSIGQTDNSMVGGLKGGNQGPCGRSEVSSVTL